MGFFPSPPANLDTAIKGSDYYIYNDNASMKAWVKENHLKPDHYWILKKYDIVNTSGGATPPWTAAVNDVGDATAFHMDVDGYTPSVGTPPYFNTSGFHFSSSAGAGDFTGLSNASGGLGGNFDSPSSGDFSIYFKITLDAVAFPSATIYHIIDNSWNIGFVTNTPGFRIYWDNTVPKITFLVNDGTNDYTYDYYPISPGSSYEFIMTWEQSSTTIKVYEASALGYDTVGTFLGGAPNALANAPDTFVVGRDPAASNAQYEGYMEAFGAWERLLSNPEIDWILNGLNPAKTYILRLFPAYLEFSDYWRFQDGFYAGGGGNYIFDHGGRRTYTIDSTGIGSGVTYDSTDAPPFLSGNLTFDGSVNAYLNTGISDTSYLGYSGMDMPFGVACWIKPNSSGAGVTGVWGKYDALGAPFPMGIYLNYDYTTNEVVLFYQDTAGTNNTLYSGGSSVPTDTWTHVMVIRNTDYAMLIPYTLKIFINGVEVALDISFVQDIGTGNTAGFDIGTHQAAANQFYGKITDFRVMCDDNHMNQLYPSNAEALYNNGNGLDY